MSSLAHFVLSAKFILALKRANLLTCVIRITGYYDFTTWYGLIHILEQVS